MISVKECKALARQNLLGRYGTIIAAQLVSSVITLLILALAAGSLVFALYGGGILGHGIMPDYRKVVLGAVLFAAFLIAGFIIAWFLSYGQIKLFLNILRGKSYGVGDIFYGFRNGSRPWTVILTSFVKYAVIYTLSMLIEVWGLLYRYGILFFNNGIIDSYAVYLTVRIVLFLIMAFAACSLFLCTVIAADRPYEGVLNALKGSISLMKGKRLKAFWFIYFSFLPWSLIAMLCPLALLWIMPYSTCSMIVFYMAASDELWQLPGSAKDEISRKRNAGERCESDAIAAQDKDEASYAESSMAQNTEKGDFESAYAEHVMNIALTDRKKEGQDAD